MNFKNKVVLITGANRGIGKSLVKAALALEVDKVYATSRVLSSLPNFNDQRVIGIELDIKKHEQVMRTVAAAKDVQVLINNAGVLSAGNILQGDMAKIKYDMEVNYFSTINMMRAFAPILEKNESARIVNIISIAPYSSLPSIAGYAASKAALLSATQSVRIELSKKGVPVHAVNPGAIDTDMNKGSKIVMSQPDDIAKQILSRVEAEELDIIPDQLGQGMYRAWREHPQKLADIFSEMYFSN